MESNIASLSDISVVELIKPRKRHDKLVRKPKSPTDTIRITSVAQICLDEDFDPARELIKIARNSTLELVKIECCKTLMAYSYPKAKSVKDINLEVRTITDLINEAVPDSMLLSDENEYER